MNNIFKNIKTKIKVKLIRNKTFEFRLKFKTLNQRKPPSCDLKVKTKRL